MSPSLYSELQAELDARASAGLTRRRRLLQGAQSPRIQCDGQSVLSFCSNDYLGLANHPALIAAVKDSVDALGVGSGASHLITGHHQSHEQLEEALADFVGLPSALLFSTGYMANLGAISALVGRDDAVFADKLNHASLNDAVVLSRAELHRYVHNDMAALETLLRASTAKRKLVVVDAVFSMDGDVAPVRELVALCERYDAYLLLDDAHGFGVLGRQGRGVLDHTGVRSPRIIYMATLGKAAGVAGAFVAGEAVLTDYLIQQCRTYIYTTASPAMLSSGLLAALQVMQEDTARHTHLHGLIELFKSSLVLRRWQLMPSDTAIQPVLVGSNDEALQLSEHLLTLGMLVPAIRPPTVPKGTARLRISLSAAHSEQDVMRLVDALQQAEEVLAT
jgi:8-amino-7-oxononanoate synthase